MKNFLIALFCLFSLSALSQEVEVDVISTSFNVEDQAQKESLCLTIVRMPNGETLGLVEGVWDCYYARLARRTEAQRLKIELKTFRPIEETELANHLQTLDPDLRFYFSVME